MNDAACARYVKWLLGATLVLLLVTAAFNRIVDPFWYFRDVEITGFNAVKTKFRRFERNVKPVILAREQPEAVILGSSFAEVGFDPLHPSLTDGGRLKSFNFALAGTPWQMNFCALEFVLATTQVKRIVLGIHAGPLPAFDCSEDIANMHDTSWPALLLSARALGASIQTATHQRKEVQPSHTREGMYFYTRFAPGVDRRFSQYFALQLQGNPACEMSNLERSRAHPAAFVPPQGETIDLRGLGRVLENISGRNVALKLVIYPRHILRVETDYLCGRGEARWQALWQIARYVETHPPAPPASVEVWDFQGYNSYTGEPLSGDLMTYWQDPEHFNYELGNVMLDWMFGAVPGAGKTVDGLGYRVATATLPARYAWFEAERAAYLRNHPETWKELRRLLPPTIR